MVEEIMAKYVQMYLYLLKKSVRLVLPLVVQLLFIFTSIYFTGIYRGKDFVQENIVTLIAVYSLYSLLILDYSCRRLHAEGIRYPQVKISLQDKVYFDLYKSLTFFFILLTVGIPTYILLGTELSFVILGLISFAYLIIYRIIHEHSIYRMSDNINKMFIVRSVDDGRI
jgi:hypothetical protein